MPEGTSSPLEKRNNGDRTDFRAGLVKHEDTIVNPNVATLNREYNEVEAKIAPLQAQRLKNFEALKEAEKGSDAALIATYEMRGAIIEKQLAPLFAKRISLAEEMERDVTKQ